MNQSFISNKREFVEIDQKRSETIKINCGLLQGDNLSQTFFSLVINSVTNVITNSKFHLYADDQSIYCHTQIKNIHTAIDALNADINNINQWMIRHGMSLHFDRVTQQRMQNRSKKITKNSR